MDAGLVIFTITLGVIGIINAYNIYRLSKQIAKNEEQERE